MNPFRARALPCRRLFAALGRRCAVLPLALPGLLPLPVSAQVMLAPDAPSTYVVRAGDTLWAVAGRFLRDPWRWPDVWQANPGVEDPNRIYPGEVLELVYEGGSPRVRAARGGGLRTVKLSPRVRVTELDRAIPTIPLSAVAPFLSRPVVTGADEIDRAPYVVGFADDKLIAGTGDAIYVRSILTASGDRYEVLRPGQAYRDPDTNRVLGYEAAFVATARLERLGDPATLVVTRSRIEVEAGDRVRPARDDEPVRSFLPRPAPAGVEGKIIAVLNGVYEIGQYDAIVLNRGSRHGLEPGQVLEVYRGGELRRDRVRSRRTDWNWRDETPLDTSFWYGDWEITGWERDRPDPNDPLPLHRRAERMSERYLVPDSRSGAAMVFRVFPDVSFALVMRATRAMHVGEIVTAPRDG